MLSASLPRIFSVAALSPVASRLSCSALLARPAALMVSSRTYADAVTHKPPAGLKYTREHEWVALDKASSVGTVGITSYAQQMLGEIVFVDLPSVGKKLKAGESFGAVESVKSASDLYSPVSGEVTEVNTGLADDYAVLNNAPYSKGWIIKVRVADQKELDQLLDESAYDKFCAGKH